MRRSRQQHSFLVPVLKMLQICPIVDFYVTVVFLSRNVIFSSLPQFIGVLVVMSFDDVVVLFKINYSLAEVSYITKAKAV